MMKSFNWSDCKQPPTDDLIIIDSYHHGSLGYVTILYLQPQTLEFYREGGRSDGHGGYKDVWQKADVKITLTN